MESRRRSQACVCNAPYLIQVMSGGKLKARICVLRISWDMWCASEFLKHYDVGRTFYTKLQVNHTEPPYWVTHFHERIVTFSRRKLNADTSFQLAISAKSFKQTLLC